MRQRRPAVGWAMAGWFQFAADCFALLILAIAVAGLVGIVVAALRDRRRQTPVPRRSLSAVASHSDLPRYPRQVRPDRSRVTAARQTADTGGARPEQTSEGASTAASDNRRGRGCTGGRDGRGAAGRAE